jgi:hypothetical protein
MFACDFKTYPVKRIFTLTLAFFSAFLYSGRIPAQQDTLRVMAYNVLHFGDGCQGTNTYLFSKLSPIVQYANPDVIGLVKCQSIKVTPTDNNGLSPYGFADTIIKYALNNVFPGRFNYCPLTNLAGSNDMDVLFYNQNKLGFVWVKTLISIQEDFDLYKLYYKDPYLSKTHDSTFLYFILNHTVSGTSPAQRDQQDTLNIDALKKMFYHAPNLISMGDFNTHSSGEVGYQAYVNNSDTSFLFDDQPFFPDHLLSYPIDWDASPSLAKYQLNTSTRLSGTYPNSCGASSGGKDWYEHLFTSRWLINNIDYIKYIGNSYVTIGNDGKRVGISENDSTTYGKNTSAPSNIINDIFFLSDKYPIMASYLVTFDSLGNGPADPVLGIASLQSEQEPIKVNNPVHDDIIVYFPANILGEKCQATCYDVCGRQLFTDEFNTASVVHLSSTTLIPGTYIIRFQTGKQSFVARIIKM